MMNQSARGARVLAAIIAAVTMLVFEVPMKADEGPSRPARVICKPMVPRWQRPPIPTPYFIGWSGAHTPSQPGFETARLLEVLRRHLWVDPKMIGDVSWQEMSAERIGPIEKGLFATLGG